MRHRRQSDSFYPGADTIGGHILSKVERSSDYIFDAK